MATDMLPEAQDTVLIATTVDNLTSRAILMHRDHHQESIPSFGRTVGENCVLKKLLLQLFLVQNVDQDRSGAITVNELQQALVNGNWTKFDLDTVKMLMSIFVSGLLSFTLRGLRRLVQDVDRSGTINFNEFAGLWKYISDWQNVFRHFDRDRSGSIEGNELSEALRSFGYNLSPNLLRLIEQKYASAPVTDYGPAPGITFDRFVRACVVVKNLTESFQRADTNRNGWVQLNYEQFMSIVLSAP
ncbi:hypothetical protein VNI00_011420 [Paramarasmius palmivorus]|uniref:EF-hand domain-containing protein n=1 Tax=Paramarasmius palmivorus TaxID=297713 RepID=A0AAW0CAI2_9AGAR